MTAHTFTSIEMLLCAIIFTIGPSQSALLHTSGCNSSPLWHATNASMTRHRAASSQSMHRVLNMLYAEQCCHPIPTGVFSSTNVGYSQHVTQTHHCRALCYTTRVSSLRSASLVPNLVPIRSLSRERPTSALGKSAGLAGTARRDADDGLSAVQS